MLKRLMLWLQTDENQTMFLMQIIRRSLLCSNPISCFPAVPPLCHSQPCLSSWLQRWRAEHFQPPQARSRQDPPAPGLQAAQRCLILSSRKHAGPLLSEKGRLKHSLLCHSVSPVSKYCSLHLNLIGLSLGIHYLHLLLVSPYQQMPT